MSLNTQPIPFDVNGTTYHAKLSPGAIMVMQRETGKRYPDILTSIVTSSDIIPLDDLLSFCTACLLREWPGLTSDALFDALELNTFIRYQDGINRMTMLVTELLRDHTPTPIAEEDAIPEPDSKNADLPETPGANAPLRATSTKSAASHPRKTSTPSGT